MSDIDLVLVLNNVRDATQLKRRLPDVKEEIISKLKYESKGFEIVGSISTSPFSVQFTVKGNHGSIDVDLLPTFYFEGNGCIFVFRIVFFWIIMLENSPVQNIPSPFATVLKISHVLPNMILK